MLTEPPAPALNALELLKLSALAPLAVTKIFAAPLPVVLKIPDVPDKASPALLWIVIVPPAPLDVIVPLLLKLAVLTVMLLSEDTTVLEFTVTLPPEALTAPPFRLSVAVPPPADLPKVNA